VKVLSTIIIALAFLVGFSALFAWVAAYFINYVFAASFLTFVFGGKITFWQAFVLNMLTGILFRSGSSSKKD
jgi:hypothetical protein